MEVTINGVKQNLPDSADSVSGLLEHLHLSGKKAVVERNGTVLKKDEHADEAVEEGDILEIVHFVGGG
ncbi:sulfur carrier protein ThiS [Alteribacillus sp. HJP-4]|uniref:sulfur carrier protein ThiS n=1 Tax=Alteribacillus sp. HJP-4 TaxID=2775394 RepID=UPI0035CCD679